jgi:hypothetical protein
MKANLDPLKELIISFKKELNELVLKEKEYPIDINERDPIQPWQRTEAYSWMFFEVNYHIFKDEFGEFRKKSNLSLYPQSLLKNANDFYTKWGMKTIDVHGCKATIAKIKEIHKYKKYGIEPPFSSESLIDYIKRLEERVPKDIYSKIWQESLFSFLEFVKANIPSECQGFIDTIFPEDRTFYEDTIIRLVRKDKFPTNIVYVAEILKNLSNELLSGDLRTQHGAAEALAFAWVCISSARLQVPTQVKLIYEFNPSSLISEKAADTSLTSYKYLSNIPTFFGHIPIEISKSQFEYFSALTKINKDLGIENRFLKSTERSLREIFDRAVNKLNIPPKHGEITFLTFTSWPTEVLHHRTQIDNARYR